MKTKIEIQRGWQGWLRNLASVSGFPQDYTGELMIELGREVDWSLRFDDLEPMVDARIDKVDSLLEAYDGSIGQFDQYWQVRRQLWEWMKA